MTASTCCPQPAHVVLPHWRHFTARHMCSSFLREGGSFQADYTPLGIGHHHLSGCMSPSRRGPAGAPLGVSEANKSSNAGISMADRC